MTPKPVLDKLAQRLRAPPPDFVQALPPRLSRPWAPHQWAVLHFRRGGERMPERKFQKLPIRDIGFDTRPAV